ncbi:hypothetical protein AcW1_008899 [Taiwanofungus camphoratus]|nr:hypothetical protein AcV5_006929 [Antrodia cinnamomea]KAI0949220.1 hypothetical protein AcW1_008899 [Antrodia cinnamomea]KAI0958959.1 hypothetical protein AcV7_004630 [Antrodia cinnamomea]
MNPFANYSTAESLGFTDPDAERLKAETERRQTQGVAGEWEVVTVSDVATPMREESTTNVAEGDPNRKREAAQELGDEDGRRFKLRRRTLGAGLGEIYDPGLIPIKIKKKEEHTDGSQQLTAESVQSSSVAGSSAPTTEKPKWSARGWNRPREAHGQASSAPIAERDGPPEQGIVGPEEKETGTEIKQEEQVGLRGVTAPVIKEEPPATIKAEGDNTGRTEDNGTASLPSTGGNLFRKRRLPAGGTGIRGRRP